MEDTHHQLVRSWMEQAPDGIFLADAEGIYLDVNRSGCEMLGRPRAEIVGHHVREFIEPDDLRGRPLALDQITSANAARTERRLRRADGSTFVAELSTTRATDGTYLSIARDVTVRRETEARSRRAEESFRLLLDVLPDAVVVHRDGVIVYANATAAAVTGCERPEDLVGTPVIEIVHVDDRAAVRERIQMMLSTGAAAGARRERIVRRDGTFFVAEVVALPVRFDGQSSVLAVARDMTDRERMQTRLTQAERLASVGLLAAGVAHEVNNPLAYALLNLERLAAAMATPDADPTLRRCVDDAIDGARRVQRTVRDLKTFAGSLHDEVERVEVGAAIDAAVKLSGNELRFRAKVRVDVANVPKVRANEARLTQVFLNLLMNAADAIAEGHVEQNEVRVTARESGETVRVEVRDTGAGIDPEHLTRLFDPFFTTREPGRGTGLGLSICHSIVSSFGGRIEVESQVGVGTAFTVVLPSATSGHPVMVPRDTGRPSMVPRTRQHLLLVEDERNMRTVLQSLLSPRYEVATAATGGEGLALLTHSDEWDVVLCDLLMPEVTGMDVYEWIEAHRPALCDRVVFMTGGAFTERARRLLERAPGRWIEKPFEFEALAELLDRVAPDL